MVPIGTSGNLVALMRFVTVSYTCNACFLIFFFLGNPESAVPLLLILASHTTPQCKVTRLEESTYNLKKLVLGGNSQQVKLKVPVTNNYIENWVTVIDLFLSLTLM